MTRWQHSIFNIITYLTMLKCKTGLLISETVLHQTGVLHNRTSKCIIHKHCLMSTIWVCVELDDCPIHVPAPCIHSTISFSRRITSNSIYLHRCVTFDPITIFTHHNHLTQCAFFITAWSESHSNNFWSSASFLSFKIKAHAHPTDCVLISVIHNYTLCFTFIDHVLLPYIKPLLIYLAHCLTHMHSKFFSPFPVSTGPHTFLSGVI